MYNTIKPLRTTDERILLKIYSWRKNRMYVKFLIYFVYWGYFRMEKPLFCKILHFFLRGRLWFWFSQQSVRTLAKSNICGSDPFLERTPTCLHIWGSKSLALFGLSNSTSSIDMPLHLLHLTILQYPSYSALCQLLGQRFQFFWLRCGWAEASYP